MLFSKTVENAGKNRIPHVGGKQQNEKVVHGRRIKERHSWTAHENSEEEVNIEIEITLFFSHIYPDIMALKVLLMVIIG